MTLPTDRKSISIPSNRNKWYRYSVISINPTETNNKNNNNDDEQGYHMKKYTHSNYYLLHYETQL